MSCKKELTNNNISQVQKLVDKYSYVSFDIFDTLIIRKTTKPRDVFTYIEKEFKIKNFKKKRILAQKIANKIYKCPNIYQIYSFYFAKISNRKKIIDIEINCEKELTKPNPNLFSLYQHCLDKNKHIIITSDMYIPKEIMIELLNKNSYYGFEKIYISCDIKKSKFNKKIYPYVLSDLSISKTDIIHIGDNIISDIENAKGIDTILVKNR